MPRLAEYFRRPRLLVTLLVFYLAISAVLVSVRGIGQIREAWTRSNATDFGPFYAAGGLILDSHRGSLYGPRLPAVAEYSRAPGNYFNPPLFALIYSPLTVFDVNTANKVLTVVTAAASLGLVALAWHWRRTRLTVLLAALATASYWPVYETLRLGNVSLLFAIAAGLCLIALEQKRMGAAGALVALLALKPSIAVAPLGFLAWLENRKAVAAALAGIVLLVLAPFLFLGSKAIDDYGALISATRHDSFTFRGGVSGGALFMFNWNGFIARLLRTDPSPVLVFPLDVLTVALMIKVWTRGNLRVSWLATTLATLLAMPHMLWYDWVLLLPAGFAVALSRPSGTLFGLLLLLHLCVNLSTLQMEDRPLVGSAFFVAAPAGLLLLVYLSFADAIEARLGRWRPHRAPAALAPAVSG